MGNAAGFCHFLCDLGKLFKVTEPQFCHYFCFVYKVLFISVCTRVCAMCTRGRQEKGIRSWELGSQGVVS